VLKVQQYLNSGKTLEDLSTEFGIKARIHPVDPLVILNYDQIDSPKMNEIVRECRGLTLEIGTWKVIAKAFDRFFNEGEALEITKDFIWEGSTALTKEDGSLIITYNYNGTWRVNTRGSFAEYNIHECGKTWAELFWEALGYDKFYSKESVVHAFELCSSYNKIVRQYKEPTAYLLAIFNRDICEEYPDDFIEDIAFAYKFKRPESYFFKNVDEVILFLQGKEGSDPTFEGLVIKDINGMRLKIKSKTYVALHQMHGNDNIFLAKNLVPFILSGEIDEVLTYFPEVEPRMIEVKTIIDAEFNKLCYAMYESNNITDQKEFALKILNKTKFTGILFRMRQDIGFVLHEKELKEYWRNSAEMILKYLF